ncbi:hypothetical protein QQM_1085 [Clostridioides difficile P2]|nr:hypothetical protein QKW_4013 [Clostridioides difficile DA00210]EQI31959.1 hypothetical protein QOO_4072 [Clostridioides difficile Y165]EQI89557.1 hypothetical protein QQM_1085 [Clostridioides difficile P2]
MNLSFSLLALPSTSPPSHALWNFFTWFQLSMTAMKVFMWFLPEQNLQLSSLYLTRSLMNCYMFPYR